MRNLFAPMAVALVLAAGVAGCGADSASTQSLAPITSDVQPDPTSTAPPVAPITLQPIGFAGGAPLLWESDDELERSLDAVVASGSPRLRMDIAWPLVEPVEGTVIWTPTDRVINAARAKGVGVLAILDYTPAWRSGASDANDITQRPSSPQAYGEFTRKVAEHFAGRISDYEIWNEPNGLTFFKPAPDPAYYAQMLKAAYAGIKSADPAAVVIGGSIGTSPDTATTMNGLSFLKRMYGAGAQGSFDALAVHPYSYPGTFVDTAGIASSPMHMVADMHNEMVAQGDGDKKIWATEVGAPTSGTDSVDDARQAVLLTTFSDQWAQLPYAGPVYIHEIRDRLDGSDVNEDSFGVLRRDFSPKQSYVALQAQIAKGVTDDPNALDMLAFARAVPGLGDPITPVYFPTDKRGIVYSKQDFADGSLYRTARGHFVTPTEIASAVDASGFAPSSVYANGMQDLDATGGVRVFFTPSTGTHLVSGSLLKSWTPELGFPTTDQFTDETTGDEVVSFQNGRIAWNETDGATVTKR